MVPSYVDLPMKHLTAWELESVEWTSEEVKVDREEGKEGEDTNLSRWKSQCFVT